MGRRKANDLDQRLRNHIAHEGVGQYKENGVKLLARRISGLTRGEKHRLNILLSCLSCDEKDKWERQAQVLIRARETRAKTHNVFDGTDDGYDEVEKVGGEKKKQEKFQGVTSEAIAESRDTRAFKLYPRIVVTLEAKVGRLLDVAEARLNNVSAAMEDAGYEIDADTFAGMLKRDNEGDSIADQYCSKNIDVKTCNTIPGNPLLVRDGNRIERGENKAPMLCIPENITIGRVKELLGDWKVNFCTEINRVDRELAYAIGGVLSGNPNESFLWRLNRNAFYTAEELSGRSDIPIFFLDQAIENPATHEDNSDEERTGRGNRHGKKAEKRDPQNESVLMFPTLNPLQRAWLYGKRIKDFNDSAAWRSAGAPSREAPSGYGETKEESLAALDGFQDYKKEKYFSEES